jgi:spore germination protein KA
MFDSIKRKILEENKKGKVISEKDYGNNNEKAEPKSDGFSEKPELSDLKLVKSLEKNISLIKQIFSDDATLITRRFENKNCKVAKCCIFYINGMVNVDIINKSIIKPVLENEMTEDISSNHLFEDIQNKIILANQIKEVSDLEEIITSITYGDTLFLLDGYDKALVIDTKGWKVRSITESTSEKTVRGPREGFTEAIMVNLSLIRRKLKTPDLKFVFKDIGRRTKTKVCMCYLESIASPQIIAELNKWIETIDIDGILDSGYIQEMIKDSPLSPFKTIGNSERPDVVVAKLLEGRIALIVDGTPDVLTLPYVFIEYFQSNEDYYNNFIYGSLGRIIRIIGAIITISVPAVYVALITYHQELIPTSLLLSISAAIQGTPFPTIVEAIVMLFAFEMLREAGTRMPTAVGQAVSIVGALVLGQAAVQAKFVSAPMVIIIALAGISSLSLPKLMGASIVIRLIFLLLAANLGLYGFIFGVIGLLIYLFSMRSFGVPYMLSLVISDRQYNKDTLIRSPWWYMSLRPKLIAVKNSIRKSDSKFKGENQQ